MARPSKFPADRILDAAAEVVVTHWRDATVSHVAERLGAPSGSIYYRFPSRDDLFVECWLRALERFHAGFLTALALPDAHQAAITAAVHVPQFCRTHPVDAVVLTLYRHSELVDTAPERLHERVAHRNDEVLARMHELALRRFGSADARRLQLLEVACAESPYGLVRRFLRTGDGVPEWLDEVVRASSAAILRLGDDDPAHAVSRDATESSA